MADRRHPELTSAIGRFDRAETEYRRAIASGEQPRLNRAGTNYEVALRALRNAAEAAAISEE